MRAAEGARLLTPMLIGMPLHGVNHGEHPWASTTVSPISAPANKPGRKIITHCVPRLAQAFGKCGASFMAGLLQGDLRQVRRRRQRDLADGRDHGVSVRSVRRHVRRQTLQRHQDLRQEDLQGRAVAGHALRVGDLHAHQCGLLAVPLSRSPASPPAMRRGQQETSCTTSFVASCTCTTTAGSVPRLCTGPSAAQPAGPLLRLNGCRCVPMRVVGHINTVNLRYGDCAPQLDERTSDSCA